MVTVCDGAKEECPYFPNARKIIHKGFPDPEEVNESEKLEKFREIRDEIKNL